LQPGSAAREAQVEALREAVASGSYRVDANQVAGRIVEDASE
jgi:anti-sigma28 factor (negative regulator of flagellin synthesis)